MEIWDAYLEDGSLAGRDLIRDEKIPKGYIYHKLIFCSGGSYEKSISEDKNLQKDFWKNVKNG